MSQDEDILNQGISEKEMVDMCLQIFDSREWLGNMYLSSSAPRAGALALTRNQAISTRKGNALTHMANIFRPSCIWQAANVPEIENITAEFSGLLVYPAVPGTRR
jgi:hypothetical protein